MPEPRFRPCRQRQPMLLPPDLSDLIPGNAMVRLVDAAVKRMDRRLLESLYPGGGAPAHDPAAMLKVVLFCYASGIYSSRKIAAATRENVNLMWLTGMEPLDHSTASRFRTERVRPVFEDVFAEVVAVLAEAGHVTLETYFLDGTKVEANANKFSFTWRKSTVKYRDRLRERVAAHLAAVDELCEGEEALAPADPAELDSAAIAEAAARIDERIARKGVGRRPRDEEGRALRKASREAERDWLPRMERHGRDLADMGGRNSLSKTDRDATFMRMKDDPMGNGQLKAAYNVQAGTENQYVVFTTVHQRPGDTACTVPHLERAKEALGHVPAAVVADAWPRRRGEPRVAPPRGRGGLRQARRLLPRVQEPQVAGGPDAPRQLALRPGDGLLRVPGGAPARLRPRIRQDDRHRVPAGRVHLPLRGLLGVPEAGRLLQGRGPRRQEDAHRRARPGRVPQAGERPAAHAGGVEAQKEEVRGRRDRLRRHQAQPRLHELHAAGPREGRARVEAGRGGPQHTEDGPRRRQGAGVPGAVGPRPLLRPRRRRRRRRPAPGSGTGRLHGDVLRTTFDTAHSG